MDALRISRTHYAQAYELANRFDLETNILVCEALIDGDHDTLCRFLLGQLAQADDATQMANLARCLPRNLSDEMYESLRSYFAHRSGLAPAIPGTAQGAQVSESPQEASPEETTERKVK